MIVAPKDVPNIANEQALLGKILALERGFGNVDYFKKNYPQVLIKEYQNTSLALGAVARGEADAYAGNRSVALYIMGQEVMTTLKVHGRLMKEGALLTIGIRKDWELLKNLLNRALADLDQEEIRRIHNRWIGAENSHKQVKLTADEQLWLKKHPTIRIAFDGNYPPYSFQNEKGEFVGIAVDIARKLAIQVGVQLEIYPHGQWKELYTAAQEGNVNVIATLVKNLNRESGFEFTRPYISLSQYVITRNENLQSIDQVASLAGKRVALIEGYSTTDLLLGSIKGIKPYYVANLQEALEAVSIGRAEATVADISISNHLILKAGLTNLGFTALYTKSKSKQRFWIRKDWPELAIILDKALESLSYQDLMNIYSHWQVPELVKPEAGFLSVMEELTDKEKNWLEEHPIIRLASDFAWPPFETIDEEGQYSGIAADYMRLIEKRLGIKFIVSPRLPWDEITEMVRNKQLDLFSCAMATEGRKNYAQFTTPYISHPMVIVTKNNVGYIDGLTGLKEKSVAIEQGYASYELLSNEHPELQLLPYSSSQAAMLAVSKGEIFAYIGNIATMSYVARNQGITNIKISGQIPYNYELALGVRDDWQDFHSILQKTLDSISLEEKNTILQKWIAVNVEKPFYLMLMWKIVGGILLVLLGIIYWNLMLKKKVRDHSLQLLHQAHFDALTDLPNRFLSLDRLAQLTKEAERNNAQVAVLFLDVDDFKKINDTLDHAAGDTLLIKIANRLRNAVRAGDSIGRLGGDEFIILLGRLKEPSDAQPVAESLLNSFRDSFKLDNRELRLTASIGIAIYPSDGNNPSALLSNADSAMYHSKKRGRNTYSYFAGAMNKEVTRRLLLEEHMHGALDRGEFQVYYQPKVGISSRHIIGFEALLRWNNPSLGQVSPVEFIPIAENNGLIIPIGQFVLEKALHIVTLWQQQYNQPFSIAVNLSPNNSVTQI